MGELLQAIYIIVVKLLKDAIGHFWQASLPNIEKVLASIISDVKPNH